MPVSITSSWQSELASSLRDIPALAEFLQLSPAQTAALLPGEAAMREFPLRVPLAYARRMRPGDPDDPLLRQILPSAQEMTGGGLADPLREMERQPLPGLIAKYRGRVLWMLTGSCAVHCRYCFRRHLPYGEMASGVRGSEAVLDWLRLNEQTHEVILSGGDPLSLPDEPLQRLAEALAQIGHLQTLRLHTRLPVVLPRRVDENLLRWLADCPLHKVVVLHINHAAEVDCELAAAAKALAEVGVRLYAQTVLLAGVNDSVQRLQMLCDSLWEAGIQPYYLHMLDPVKGAAHFDVSQREAQLLYGELSARMPGYRLPRLVREMPGMPAKTLVPPMFSTTSG